MTEPTERCDNCFKSYPESKIATHFSYCRRNIKRCNECGEMYDINEVEQHQEEFHKKVKCPDCKKQIEAKELTTHQVRCEMRTQFCEYCENNVHHKDYPTHLQACESRTKNCDKCNQPVTNKNYLTHIVSCTGPVEKPKQQNQDYQSYVNSVRAQKQESRNTYDRVSYKQPESISYKDRVSQYGVTNQYNNKSNSTSNNNYSSKPSSNIYSSKPISTNSTSNKPITSTIPSKPVTTTYKYQDKYKIDSNKVIKPSGTTTTTTNTYLRGASRNKEEPSRKHIALEGNSYKRQPIVTKIQTKPITHKVQTKTHTYKAQTKPISSNHYVHRAEILEPTKPTQYQTKYTSSTGAYRANKPQPKVIYPTQKAQRVQYKKEQPKPDHRVEDMIDNDLIGEDQELQRAIMMSMQGNGGSKSNYMLEGGLGDQFNESFIAKQRAIEEELFRRK